jgi:hypothetical protein
MPLPHLCDRSIPVKKLTLNRETLRLISSEATNRLMPPYETDSYQFTCVSCANITAVTSCRC